MAQSDKEASQRRDFCGAGNAPHRPDPSLRNIGLLRLTNKLHH